ncbi:MAG: hypothetical protein ACYS80_23820 [Planctomycetota bacterium]|jgi:hypothetical protein
MRELERLQMLRKLEEEAAEEQSAPEPSFRPAPAQAIPSTALRTGPKASGFEATTRTPADKEVNLKKQSQFAPALMGVNALIGGNYENKCRPGLRKNKAKQSQFQSPTGEKGPQEFSVENIRPGIVSKICEISG